MCWAKYCPTGQSSMSWEISRSLARSCSQESMNAANFQLAKTHYKGNLHSEQPGISIPIGICNGKMHRGGRLNKPFQISVSGESFILSRTFSSSFDHWPFETLGDSVHITGEFSELMNGKGRYKMSKLIYFYTYIKSTEPAQTVQIAANKILDLLCEITCLTHWPLLK